MRVYQKCSHRQSEANCSDSKQQGSSQSHYRHQRSNERQRVQNQNRRQEKEPRHLHHEGRSWCYRLRRPPRRAPAIVGAELEHQLYSRQGQEDRPKSRKMSGNCYDRGGAGTFGLLLAAFTWTPEGMSHLLGSSPLWGLFIIFSRDKKRGKGENPCLIGPIGTCA